MLRAFVLDFDGLILDTETPLIDAYAAVHAAHGVPFDRARFLHDIGHADFSFDPWHGFHVRPSSQSDGGSQPADRVALEVERRAAKEQIILRLPVLPGVVALLDTARDHRLRVGVASNSSHSWVDGHLRRLGLFARFDHIACREDVASPKPEPDLYKLVLNRFGLRGHEAVAFEDSQTGLQSARRANLWTVAAPNESTVHHDFSRAHWRVRSLAEVSLTTLRRRFERAPLKIG